MNLNHTEVRATSEVPQATEDGLLSYKSEAAQPHHLSLYVVTS